MDPAATLKISPKVRCQMCQICVWITSHFSEWRPGTSPERALAAVLVLAMRRHSGKRGLLYGAVSVVSDMQGCRMYLCSPWVRQHLSTSVGIGGQFRGRGLELGLIWRRRPSHLSTLISQSNTPLSHHVCNHGNLKACLNTSAFCQWLHYKMAIEQAVCSSEACLPYVSACIHELRRVTQRRLIGGLGRPDRRVWARHLGAFAGRLSGSQPRLLRPLHALSLPQQSVWSALNASCRYGLYQCCHPPEVAGKTC